MWTGPLPCYLQYIFMSRKIQKKIGTKEEANATYYLLIQSLTFRDICMTVINSAPNFNT